jgi:hypothetical protein
LNDGILEEWKKKIVRGCELRIRLKKRNGGILEKSKNGKMNNGIRKN